LLGIVSLLNFRSLIPIAAALSLGACMTVTNDPINEPALSQTNLVEAIGNDLDSEDTTVIGLGFSGGGTRAAAFSYGVLRELEATPMPGDPQGRSMLDSVRFISGVSGGSVTAAYYGLKGRQGYHDLRERFLVRDAEADMRTRVGPTNILRAIGGGVNDKSSFGRWLDKNLFNGARFADLNRPGAPVVWINASDLYNRTPFIFNDETFAALCSNLDSLPISEAVAASAAVPVVFAPIVLEAYGKQCVYHEPGWLGAAKQNPSAPSSLRAFAGALESYRDATKLKYVKLVDGGITDNFGVTALTLARAQSQTPYGPLTPREAVKLNRIIYLVADAGVAPDGKWGATVQGPGVVDLITAVTDTAISASVRDGYDAFRMTMDRWQKDLIDYRCSLKQTEVKRLRGTLAGWNCRDLKFFVGDVSFADVEPVKRARLQKILTRLKLPTAEVDLAIAGGSEALRNDPTFIGALRSIAGAETAGKSRMMPSEAAAVPMPTPITSN
jgi:predicted acylesterase/phospholipase RssA